MKKKLPIIVAASLGGITPNLVRLGISLTGENATFPERTYVFGILIFAIMGGVIGWVWGETDLKKAFYLGIGLPSLIQLNIADLPQSRSRASGSAFLAAPGLSFLVPSVAAQEPEQPRRVIEATQPGVSTSNTKMLSVHPQGEARQYTIVFTSQDGKRREEATVTTNTALRVPSFASQWEIRSANSESAIMSIPTNSAPVVVQPKEKRWSGFFRALGMRDVQQYEIQTTQGK